MHNFRTLFLLLIIIATVSCSQKKLLRVVEVNFTDEVGLQQNLVFTFNKPVVADSTGEQWDSIQYFTFNPPVEGRYKWVAPDQLMFSPVEGFQPFTDYKIELNKNINISGTETFSIRKQNFSFSTAPLKIDEVRPFWTSTQAGTPGLNAFIEFNYTIMAEDLSPLLSVTMDDKNINYSIITSGETNIVELSLETTNPQSIKSSELEIVLQPGLGCLNSKNKTTEKMNASASISGFQKFEITDITQEYNEGVGLIRVYTNQSLMINQIEELIKLTPQITYQTEIHQDGFSLEGDFLQGATYRITISANLTGILGNSLEKEIVREITFGELTPRVAFDDQNGIYLSTAGEKNIAINIISVPKVKLTIFKIFENNILEYMRMGKGYEWYEEDEMYYDSYTYPLNENYGRQVFSKIINTNALPKKGNIRLLKLNPSDFKMNEKYKGMYLVKIESINEKYLNDVALVSFSDIGLIVKKGRDHYMVFARSIISGEPLKDVLIDFISTNNQKVYQTRTDSKGIAWLKDAKKTIENFDVTMLTAGKGDDFTFILLNDARVETSRFDIDGKHLENLDYDVFIYSQRNLYRPGDSVFVNMVARTPDWKTPTGIPFKIKVISPTGREFLSVKKTSDNRGCSETRFHLPQGCNTGRYILEVYSFDDVLQNTYTFSVEEFLPDRIKLNGKTNKTEYKPDETIQAGIDAFYFYGPPASGRKVEMELQLKRSAFSAREFQEYNFIIGGAEEVELESTLSEGIIGNNGTYSTSFTVPGIHGIGLVKASLFTSVFDDAGKAINYLNTMLIYTQDVFFGIREGNTWIPTKNPTEINFIAVDKNGKLTSKSEARVIIRRKTWETVAEKVYNRIKYVSVARETTIMDKTIKLNNGKHNLPFTPSISGEYEVRIMPVNGDGYVSQTFYAYGDMASFSSFKIDKDGQIDIKPDKDIYRPGEKAQLLFTAPFSGDLFVTVEQSETVEYHYLKLENKATKLTLNLKDSYVPNIFISATAMIKPGSQSIPLLVAHGYQSVRVIDERKKLPVTIDCATLSPSKQKQTITVKTLPDAALTVSVVDEGILQITRYSSPDPFEYFYRNRALEVSSYDIYPWLYPEIRSNSSTGAAEPFDLGKRVNPLTNRRVKLATYWSGLLRSDKNGNAKFTIDIPQFSGSLRVMAAAFKDASFGSAEKNIKVADKVVITSALPLFLSPGDQVEVPVSIANTTSTPMNLKINIQTSGAVMLDGNYDKTLNIKGNAEAKVIVPFMAKKEMGNASITIEVSGKNEKFKEVTEITIRPPSTFETLTRTGSIEGGAAENILIKNDFIPSTASHQLIVSRSPVAGLTRDLSFLLNYPYGCTEQIISATFPQIYLEDLTKLVKSNNKSMVTGLNVSDGIKKVESLQLPEGGWNYWPGMASSNPWLSVYALNFLLEAKKAGYEVNDQVVKKATRLVESISKSNTSTEYTSTMVNNKEKVEKVFKRETIYALYVMALAGKPNLASMNFYKARVEQLTPDSKYMLGAAYGITGNMKAFNSLTPSMDFKNLKNHSGESAISSEIRDIAISLNMLIDADPGNLKIAEMSRNLTQKVQNTKYLNTQEAAFSLMALGKLARLARKSNVEFQVSESSKILNQFTGNDVYQKNRPSGNWNIKTSGSGKAWYFAEACGMSATGRSIEADNGLRVKREYFTRNGEKISPSGSGRSIFGSGFSTDGGEKQGEMYNFEINDLIIVKITLETLITDVDNIAITDVLPACFQTENQRLNEKRELDWTDVVSIPTYFDIRDDRIHIFTDIGRKPLTFYYTVRVTAKGEFSLGPVMAEAMYMPTLKSVHGQGMVKVK